jgi:hypothetical protein
MTMRMAAELTTKPTRAIGEYDVPESEIWFSGRPTGKRVPGAVLEAAVRVGGDYLLFMTDDVPFEEFLRIILVDENLNVKDSARIGSMYSTGAFSDLEMLEPHSVRFQFIGGTPWTVRVLDRPQFRVPLFGDAPGVSRPIGLTRHFTVHGNPQPQRR